MKISKALLLITLGLYGVQKWLDGKIPASESKDLNSFNFLKTFKKAKISKSLNYIWLKFIVQILLVSAFILGIGLAIIKITTPSLLDGFDYDF